MHQIMTPLIYVLAFAGVVLVVQAIAHVLFSSQDRKEHVNRRLAILASGVQPAEAYAALIRRPSTNLGDNLTLIRWYNQFYMYCSRAGLEITPMRLLAIVGAGAGVLWLLSLVTIHNGSFSGAVVSSAFSLLGSCLISGLAAWIWLSRRRAKRLRVLEEQMPLTLDVINRAIRAGHPVISAVQLAASEMGDPIGSEFGLIVDETTYGLEFREALLNFARRTGSPDAHYFAVSVSIQSETGGNLAEILAGLATVIRGRSTLAKRVKALSSEGRASALLLSALPIFLVGFLLLTQPSFYSSKFADPIFWPTAGVVGIVYLLGWVMIRRIINFKY
jgi:tight adherence protein B